MYNSLLLPDLRVMLDEQDDTSMESFGEALHAAVVAEVLEGLEGSDVWREKGAVGTVSAGAQETLAGVAREPCGASASDGRGG